MPDFAYIRKELQKNGVIKSEDEFQLQVKRLHELNNVLSDLELVLDEEKILLLKEGIDRILIKTT